MRVQHSVRYASLVGGSGALLSGKTESVLDHVILSVTKKKSPAKGTLQTRVVRQEEGFSDDSLMTKEEEDSREIQEEGDSPFFFIDSSLTLSRHHHFFVRG